jgi:excisionase family DNA binding protein
MDNRTRLRRQQDRAFIEADQRLQKVRELLGSDLELAPSSLHCNRVGPASKEQKKLLTVAEVCSMLGYKRTKIYDLMKSGLLPYVVDTAWSRRIEYRAVEQFIGRLRARRFKKDNNG